MYNLLRYELYLFVFLVPLFPYRVKIKGIPISADTVIGGIFIITYIIYILFGKKSKTKSYFRKNVIKDHLNRSVLLYVVAMIISLLGAKSKMAGLMEIGRFFEYLFFFYFIIIEVRDNYTLDIIYNVFTISIVIALICGIVQIFLLGSASGQAIVQKIFYSEKQVYGFRVYSTFVNPNYWGAFVNLILFIYLFKSLHEKNKNVKNFYIIISALCLTNLVFSFTLSSLISLIITFIIIVIANMKNINFRHVISILLLIVLISALMLIMIPSLRFKVGEILSQKRYTGSERIKLWETGFLMFKDHPFSGIGIGNYNVNYSAYVKMHPELYLGRTVYSVHNSYIKILCETGIIGLTMYAFLLFNLFKRIIAILKNCHNKSIILMASAVLYGGLTFVIQNITNNLFFIPQANIFFWILIAMVISSHNIYLMKNKESDVITNEQK